VRARPGKRTIMSHDSEPEDTTPRRRHDGATKLAIVTVIMMIAIILMNMNW
jgi:hypothetical protein